MKYIRYQFLVLTILLSAVAGINFAHAEEEGAGDYIPEILELSHGETVEDLEAQGIIVWRHRGDLALALVPASDRKGSAPRGSRPALPRRNYPVMDIARTHADADKAIAGNSLPAAFTGNGVVVGFCDIGFDPMHINFMNPDGSSRVKRLVRYDETHAVRDVYEGVEEYRVFGTDNKDKFHATHVAGILAGSYEPSGYQGIAKGADIVATVSTLYDVGLLCGAEDIIEYAKSVGKPAVINMSVGNNNGPRDGSSLFCRYLEMLGEDAIICMSAGNEGNTTTSYALTFTEKRKEWRARIHSRDWSQFDMYGMTDVWSRDATPAGIRFMIYDEETREVMYQSPLFDSTEEFSYTIDSASDAEFAKYYTGYVRLYGGISPLNGRWMGAIEYDAETDIVNSLVPNVCARYNLGLQVCGAPGVSVDIHADAGSSKMWAWPSYEMPTSDLTVSDLVTGANVISVGMYNNRKTEPLLEGGEREFDFDPLQVNSASGFGTLVDGRVLPHTVAPGAAMISSYSSRYLEEHPDRLATAVCAKADTESGTYYWGNESGTSMSSPYVAGFVATWLEADPTLDVKRALEVIESTNTMDVADSGNPRHGKGWFRPWEAVKMVVRNSGIAEGAVDAVAPSLMVRGRVAEILNPAAERLTLTVMDLSGAIMLNAAPGAERVSSVDLSALPAGIYILSLNTLTSPVKTLKIILK